MRIPLLLLTIMFLQVSTSFQQGRRGCNLRASDLRSAAKLLESCFSQGGSNKTCNLELTELRKSIEAVTLLNATVDVLRTQLSESAYRERSLIDSLAKLSYKGSSPSDIKPSLSPCNSSSASVAVRSGLQLSTTPSNYRFVQDARHVGVYQYSNENRQAIRTSMQDRGFLALFLYPALAFGQVHEASFRILSTGSNILASGTDIVAFGISARANENFDPRQIWSAPTSLMLRSLDGSYYQLGGRWISYIGRPLVILDVLTVRVNLTVQGIAEVTYGINGKYGVPIRRNLVMQPGLQVYLVVENFAQGSSVEVL